MLTKLTSKKTAKAMWHTSNTVLCKPWLKHSKISQTKRPNLHSEPHVLVLPKVILLSCNLKLDGWQEAIAESVTELLVDILPIQKKS